MDNNINNQDVDYKDNDSNPENSQEKTTTNNYIDNLTLELLINKNHYKKYLSTKNPEKYKEYQDFCLSLASYSNDIIEITENLLLNPKNEISREITESFEQYVKACIYHLEMKKIEKHDYYNSRRYDDIDEEETLFGNIEPIHSSSYWGKTIRKI
jgi:hypothetical protein